MLKRVYLFYFYKENVFSLFSPTNPTFTLKNEKLFHFYTHICGLYVVCIFYSCRNKLVLSLFSEVGVSDDTATIDVFPVPPAIVFL